MTAPHSLTVRAFLENAVERNADQPYLIWAGSDGTSTQETYEQFNAQVDAAAAYWHHIGVRRGERHEQGLGAQRRRDRMLEEAAPHTLHAMSAGVA